MCMLLMVSAMRRRAKGENGRCREDEKGNGADGSDSSRDQGFRKAVSSLLSQYRHDHYACTSTQHYVRDCGTIKTVQSPRRVQALRQPRATPVYRYMHCRPGTSGLIQKRDLPWITDSMLRERGQGGLPALPGQVMLSPNAGSPEGRHKDLHIRGYGAERISRGTGLAPSCPMGRHAAAIAH